MLSQLPLPPAVMKSVGRCVRVAIVWNTKLGHKPMSA